MWVNRPLQVSQLGQLSLSSFLGRYMSSKLASDVCCSLQVAPSGERYGGNRRLVRPLNYQSVLSFLHASRQRVTARMFLPSAVLRRRYMLSADVQQT